MTKHVLRLQPSETTVTKVAATIYAAHIVAGHVEKGKEKEIMQESIRDAVYLAMTTDEAIQSDDELS